jgi:2-beta-glucuronyltransferase
MAKVLIFSEQDYRTARRANLHPIADALVGLGHEVTFISLRYSLLSAFKRDSRNGIRVNVPERVNNIQCYLWRTIVHPLNLGPGLSNLTAPLYRLYPQLCNEFLDQEIQTASDIIVESGFGVILLARIRGLNQSAKIIYYASDDVGVIGAHSIVQHILEGSEELIDFVCLASRRMASKFSWMRGRLYFVPHGITSSDFDGDFDSPYPTRLNGVSVGYTLFDPEFFDFAAPAFPNVDFYVIGCAMRLRSQRNVKVYDEMPFKATIPFVKNATFGIAPYRPEVGSEYMCDTSMKLLQYRYVGIPAVCPDFAVGHYPNRFGYRPGDAQSIKTAIEAALAVTERVKAPDDCLTWDDVARRVLNPHLFSDTGVA